MKFIKIPAGLRFELKEKKAPNITDKKRVRMTKKFEKDMQKALKAR